MTKKITKSQYRAMEKIINLTACCQNLRWFNVIEVFRPDTNGNFA